MGSFPSGIRVRVSGGALSVASGRVRSDLAGPPAACKETPMLGSRVPILPGIALAAFALLLLAGSYAAAQAQGAAPSPPCSGTNIEPGPPRPTPSGDPPLAGPESRPESEGRPRLSPPPPRGASPEPEATGDPRAGRTDATPARALGPSPRTDSDLAPHPERCGTRAASEGAHPCRRPDREDVGRSATPPREAPAPKLSPAWSVAFRNVARLLPF